MNSLQALLRNKIRELVNKKDEEVRGRGKGRRGEGVKG